MSAFGKVTYNENENTAVESIVQETESVSALDKQLEKFDTNISSDKLQKLYEEYDKITIDEETIKSFTQVKANAVSKSMPFRLVLGITTTAIVSVLLLFLCVYNIFVINGMSDSISYLQGEVVSYQQELIQSEGVYQENSDLSNIGNSLAGYVPMEKFDETTSSEDLGNKIVTVSVPESAEVIELQGETNWFDSICNFLSRVFG